MESELRIMEKDVTELKIALTSKQGITPDKFKVCHKLFTDQFYFAQ